MWWLSGGFIAGVGTSIAIMRAVKWEVMKSKDPDYAIKVEKAIAEKYGNDTVQNPKANWTDEKEKEYLEQLEEVYKNSPSLHLNE